MNKYNEIYEYLKEELIKWRPKRVDIKEDGEGFHDDNVRNFTSTLPSLYIYDFVYIAPPVLNSRGITTATRQVQRSTQTFTIEIYCRRGGSGAAMKKATLEALNETTAFISDLFAKNGFIISGPAPDLKFTQNDVAQQILNVTKTFIQ